MTVAHAVPRALRPVPASDLMGHIGELRFIPARQLLVDRDYQRAINNRRVDAIAAEFDPEVFGVLVANERDNGHIYIIDGQHRWEAIRRLHLDDLAMPVYVVKGLLPADEARIFWKTNMQRLHLGSYDTFKARLAAKEPAALLLAEIAREADVHLMPYPGPLGPNDLMAYSTAERLMEQGVLRETLAVLRGAWPYEKGALRAPMLAGVGRLLLAFPNRVDPSHVRETLALHGPREIQSRGSFYRDSLQSRPSAAFARALHFFYNEKPPASGKLPEFGDRDDFGATR